MFAKEFTRLWIQSQRDVTVYILAAVPRLHDAEDLTQRTAMAAFDKFGTFDRERGEFLYWVLGIARYEILRWQRERRRDRHLFDDEILTRMAQAYQHHTAETKELEEQLMRCIDRLQGRTRHVLELRYRESIEPAMIAKRIGTTPGSIRVTLHRARQALLKCIGMPSKSKGARA